MFHLEYSINILKIILLFTIVTSSYSEEKKEEEPKKALSSEKESKEITPEEEEEQSIYSKSADVVSDGVDMVDGGRKYVGGKFKWFMTEVDRFFAPEVYEDEVNTSYFRVFFDMSKTQGESLTNAFNFKFQAKFPALTKGSKVIIKKEGEDAATSLLDGENAQSQNPGANTAQEAQPEGYSAAVRKFVLETTKTNISYDLGMKMNVPLDPFAKIRLRRLWEWEEFSMRFVQSNEYYKIDRLFNESSLYFDYKLNQRNKIQLRNSYYWAYKSDASNFNHNLNFYHAITEKIAFAWNISANAVIEDDGIYYNSYGLSTGYRTLLFKDWFFGEVSLGTNFPKEEDFKSKAYITGRLDMIF